MGKSGWKKHAKNWVLLSKSSSLRCCAGRRMGKICPNILLYPSQLIPFIGPQRGNYTAVQFASWFNRKASGV